MFRQIVVLPILGASGTIRCYVGNEILIKKGEFGGREGYQIIKGISKSRFKGLEPLEGEIKELY